MLTDLFGKKRAQKRSLSIDLFGQNLLQPGEAGQAVFPGVVGLTLDQGHGIGGEFMGFADIDQHRPRRHRICPWHTQLLLGGGWCRCRPCRYPRC